MGYILLRYSEIGLKSKPVRKRFEDVLISNIKSGLNSEGISFRIRKDYGRIYIETKEIRKVSEILKKIFGLISFSVCQKTSADMDSISKLALKIASENEGYETFAIKTRRVGTHPFTSKDVCERVGETIVKRLKKSVNLTNPDKIIYIEIRKKDAYLYTEIVSSVGGLPLGTQGKMLSIIKNKNGIVSSWLSMKRGCETVLFFTKIDKRDVKQFLNVLKKWCIGLNLKYYYEPKCSNLKSIMEVENVDGIVVSLDNIQMKQLIELKQFGKPVFTPLVGLTKNEIENIFRRILI